MIRQWFLWFLSFVSGLACRLPLTTQPVVSVPRRFAISDPHGCAATLAALLATLQLQAGDALYLLGDYVNKGPDARGVLDQVLRLQKAPYEVVALRGNHEQELLDAALDEADPEQLARWQDKLEWAVTMDSFGIAGPHQLQPRYRKLLELMPYYLELDDYVLVHAGLNFDKPGAIWADTAAMLTAKGYTVDPAALGGRTLVHGHTPTPLLDVRRQLKTPGPAEICLDTGCVYYKNAALGNLVALDLDTRELLVQPNLDRPYPISRK